MFKDASKELARIEAELLAEEPEEEPVDAQPEEDPWAYEDTAPARGSVIYQNYSNDYGKNLRNYASGYHAYNSDTTDEDLEEYSQQVHEGKRSGGGVLAVLLVLILLLSGVLLFVAWQKGYLG